MSKLSDKIDWAIKEANAAYDNGEPYEQYIAYIKKIYPGNKIPAWERDKLRMAV